MRNPLFLIVFICILLWGVSVYAQGGIPEAPYKELPGPVEIILGAIAAFIVEFIQKQKSPLVSLLIAVTISVAVGLLSTILVGVKPDNLAVFLVQVYTMATLVWAVLFKGFSLKKYLARR